MAGNSLPESLLRLPSSLGCRAVELPSITTCFRLGLSKVYLHPQPRKNPKPQMPKNPKPPKPQTPQAQAGKTPRGRSHPVCTGLERRSGLRGAACVAAARPHAGMGFRGLGSRVLGFRVWGRLPYHYVDAWSKTSCLPISLLRTSLIALVQ